MSQQESQTREMDAAEVEFLAEKELVKIIPNFSLDKIYLIGVRARLKAHVIFLYEWCYRCNVCISYISFPTKHL